MADKKKYTYDPNNPLTRGAPVPPGHRPLMLNEELRGGDRGWGLLDTPHSQAAVNTLELGADIPRWCAATRPDRERYFAAIGRLNDTQAQGLLTAGVIVEIDGVMRDAKAVARPKPPYPGPPHFGFTLVNHPTREERDAAAIDRLPRPEISRLDNSRKATFGYARFFGSHKEIRGEREAERLGQRDSAWTRGGPDEPDERLFVQAQHEEEV